MPKKYKDMLFSGKKKVADFVFDGKVTLVFDEMLERSVPFYGEIQRMIVELVKSFARPNTSVYDLGCSTGTTVSNIIRALRNKKIKVVGVDSSPHMLKVARERLKEQKLWSNVFLREADLNRDFRMEKPSVVLLILTLQFVRPLERESLIRNIYRDLQKGGAIIIVDKILGKDSLTNRLFIDMYHAFKERRGYSKLEISRKREALENVLIPYRLDENIMLLRRSGFETVDIFFTWYNFSGLIGVKK
ncbi:MAG: carboxy-S-adenosyl-L-methionine synthase CmoA [Candidatus Omnitrophota bacterium]